MIEELIRQKRIESGLTLRAVAQKIGVSPAYLSRIEAGKVPASEHILKSLARLFHQSDDEFLLLAGKIPGDIKAMISKKPYQAATAIRTMAEMMVAEPGTPYGEHIYAQKGHRAIEDGFPFEAISEIAEVESWRKEVYRPIYHVHKWWAQRLGSVFRAAILGSASPKGSSISTLFYEPIQLPGIVVFDPFMGSGTTIGEASKLGCTAVGRDINPVAYKSVSVAMGPAEKKMVEEQFRLLESRAAPNIKKLYTSKDSDGNACDILYYFWVKYVNCPECQTPVDLFSKYVFAKHAYPKKYPEAQMLCPDCGQIISGRYDSTETVCISCNNKFNPQSGTTKRSTAICTQCSHEFPIAKTAKTTGYPPQHRAYAKLVLRKDGRKEYLPITDEDRLAYDRASDELKNKGLPIPEIPIRQGYNTKQIINYGYRYWHELFNDRQLLSLSILMDEIRKLPVGAARDSLALLFSGVLEFNNMFASYKGEGTGAVRHMFSHHILKPERTPIEANPWGTPKSSGSFSTLYKSRLIRALDYKQNPFELAVDYSKAKKSGKKVFGISPAMGSELAVNWPENGLPPGSVYLSCGDSAQTNLPDKSVDLVITDPPFFDNVHYSELADFFYVWQKQLFEETTNERVNTTRSPQEVQDADAVSFAEKLTNVFKECHRVLKNEGLLVFSYHHSRDEGWTSVANAVLGAGFSFVQSQPVKAEMSSAAPKSQAKEPIDIDVLLVCRKLSTDRRGELSLPNIQEISMSFTEKKVQRFNRTGRHLSRNDVRIVYLSQLLVELSTHKSLDYVLKHFEALVDESRDKIEMIWSNQQIEKDPQKIAPQLWPVQLDLL